MTVLAIILAVGLGEQSMAAEGNDESVLKAARLQTTDKALLDFFRKRVQPTSPRATIERLAKMLASKDSAEADAAQGELISLGAPVVPVVREIANQQHEVQASKRARQVLQMIEGPQAASVPLEAARLLAVRKPAGAAEVLLGYLPFADNDAVFEQIETSLIAVSVRDGKADPALLAAVKDPHAVRRAMAAKLLCQVGGVANAKAVRPLLKDPQPTVRLRAALALADANDSQAIPVLIEWLADAPLPLQSRAEAYLTRLAGDWALSTPRGHDRVSRELRRDAWALWWKKTDGAKLLAEFKSRTLTDKELEKAQALLGKLENGDRETTESAADELVAMGQRVTSLLRRTINQGKPQVSAAAMECLHRIERDVPSPLPDAALRIIQLRRPEGAAATLLAFLPCAESDEATSRLTDALKELGVVDGKPDEDIVKALKDKVGVRREVAAVVLCAKARSSHLGLVRNLLRDPDPAVRLKVTLALAAAGDRDAVPALIVQVAELPTELSAEAENYLSLLAGDAGPEGLPDGDNNRKKRSSAWATWWQTNKNKVVLIDPSGPATGNGYRGFTLLVQPQTNSVTGLGLNGKPRWTLKGLSSPTDAEVVAGQRVLVVEQDRVTERDLRGKILWQKEVSGPLNVQRLRNGNTFIACQIQLLEVDRAGKEVMKIALRRAITAARKLPDGRFVAFDRRQVILLDKSGREVKSTSVNCGGAGRNEVLDNGHVLALSPGIGNIIEFDVEGNEVGRFDVPGAAHGFRLPNGNTLVTTEAGKCLEIDRTWKKVVKETALPNPAFRVKRY
jgi:hypothetical protein